MTNRRSKALSHSGSRCLSPLTPRRLASQTSPRIQPAAERLRHRESRRWSCHSIPSIPSDRGYLTQTPPYSNYSSSQERGMNFSGVDSVEDLRKCTSLTSSVSSHHLQLEKQDIQERNLLYRERFPILAKQMEDQLEQFIKEETEIEETSTSGDAAWGFVHKQVIEIARVTLQRARDNSITCRIFADNSERCQVLKNDGKQKSGVISESVLNCIRKYMKITSRPSRLLQYIEFDTEEYISILDQLEDEGQTNNSRDPPHQYVLKKLGLDKPTSNMDNEKESSDENEIQQEKSQDVKINEADFEKHKLISQGAYAKVYLVKHRQTNERYAMKRITKSSLRLRNQVQRAFLERDIMTFTENPFVVSMYCAFETQTHLCMIMEYVEGGDVRTLLKNIVSLPEEWTQMYAAEVVLALEYLHSYGIVHRDLKPDNLLITSIGHIKLTDFGLSKVGLMKRATELYEDRQEEDAPMFGDAERVGTPDYFSPEVVLQQAYSIDVDWWAFGVVLYEFVHGITPFYAETVEDVFSNIVKGKIEFMEEEDCEDEEELIDPNCRDIIQNLLLIEPANRLASAEDIKAHPYFEDVDWNNIIRQKAQFIPELSNEDDTSYFDPRCDRYHHNSSDEESAILDELSDSRASSEVNLRNLDFASTSQKYNSSFRKYERESPAATSPKSEPGTLTPLQSRHSLNDSLISPAAAANAAKEIMNHHESKSRIIRESSFDSITDELANRNRVSSTSSDTDIKFFISGESDEEETITPTGNLQLGSRDLLSRRFSNSSESDCAPVRALLSQDRFRHLSDTDIPPYTASSGRRVPKSASTSSIPESRLIIPNDYSNELFGRSSQVHSSNPSSRDSSPNRCASPLLGDTRHIKIRTVRNRAESLVGTSSRLKNKTRDIGFLLSTIPVYIGSSNNYTLHHIVSKVSPDSEAEKAGLKAMDLITHVNGEIIQGCLNTEVLNLIYSEGDELTLSSNRSSTARQSFSKYTPNPLTRSRSFTSRSSRRSPIGSERPSPRLSPVSFADHSLSNISVPSDVTSGRTSPRQKRPQRKQFPKFTNTISFKDKSIYSGKNCRRKSAPMGGSHPVSAIVSGSKPLSPLAAGQHLPLSPLARTPSPGPERFQDSDQLLPVPPRLTMSPSLSRSNPTTPRTSNKKCWGRSARRLAHRSKKGVKEVYDFESAKRKRRPGPLKNGGWTCLTVIEDDSYVAVSRIHRTEQVVAGLRLGSKEAWIIDTPSDKPLIHINRDSQGNIVVVDSEGTLFHWHPLKEWMTVQRDFVVSSKSTIVSKFVDNKVVLLILTCLSQICNASVVKLYFDKEKSAVDRLKLDCYTFPLADCSPDFEVGMTATISRKADYLVFTMSYRYPKQNEIIFMNPNNNGSILRINLEGCGINAGHIHNPTPYEATRYKVASIQFSVCDYMVFGLTSIGTMFVVSTLGSLHELVSNDNTVTNKPTKFLPVALFEPLLNRPPQIYSLSASFKDPFLLASDGYGLNIIKYPNLHLKNMNIFLNQLLTSSYLLLNRKEMEPESASDSRALTIKPSQIKKKNIPNFFKNVFDTVMGKPKDGQLQISTSTNNLNLPETEVATDSEHSDDEVVLYKKEFNNKIRERFNLALLPAFEKGANSKLTTFEIIRATEESIRGSLGAILVKGELSEDEHNCLVDIVTLFGRFSAAAVYETPRMGETVFNLLKKISMDISQLGWWDQRKGIILGLLDRVTDLLLCAQGSLIAKVLVSQPFPAEWKHTLLTTEAELSKTYRCKILFELARSDVYKLCCSSTESPELFQLKQWLHRELCDIGVVPLSLPADETHKNEELTEKERQMCQYLSQYDILAATTLFCQLLVDDVKSLEANEQTYERIYAMSTFVLFVSAFYGRQPVLIPSPSVNRNLVLEPSLIKKSIEMSQMSTHFNPSMGLSLILLTADFSSASTYCSQLHSIQNAIALQAISPIFSLEYNHSSRMDVKANELNKLMVLLEKLVDFRISNFMKDDHSSNNQLPFSIISPFIIANCAKIDLLTTTIHGEIEDVLGLLNRAGAGNAEPGPFAPLVLAQPGILNDGSNEEKLRAVIAKKIQLCLSLLNAAGVDRFFSQFFGSKVRSSIAKTGDDTDAADLFLNELRNIQNQSVVWDDQTKPLFACLRVLFSFLWMFFCRDQYRRAAFLFRRAVEGDEAIAQGTTSELVQTSSHLINKIARLYQFSDVLHCRADLQSAMITAAMESKPNEQISNQLARIFYNPEMICRQNDRERLKFLVDHKLDLYLPDGTRQDDTLDLVPGGTCRDVFIRQCEKLEQQEYNFHISGENFDEYIAHFGRTKFKKYERSSDFLSFMAAQIHLFQANMDEKPISLIQNRHEIICRLAKDYHCQDQFNPFTEAPKYDLPMVSAGSAVSRQQEHEGEKNRIKEKLTNALNLSTTASPTKSPHKRSSSTSNLGQRSDSILFSLKTKASSTEHLNRTGLHQTSSNKALRKVKSLSLGERDSGSLRTFISRRMSDLPGFRSKLEDTPEEALETYEPRIIDLLDELSESELYTLSRSAGGRQVLDTNIAALLNWVFMDQKTASNPHQPLESISINRFHLTLATLIHDKRTTKRILGMIDRINNTVNESLDASKMEMVTRMASPPAEDLPKAVFTDSPRDVAPEPDETVPEVLVLVSKAQFK
ncbi:Oidioi.mRNA.OKI2018_I69.XSR.g13946.t1.cds [Oikopleura dioica]|uniref:non-specific serine/threonine protein kinase n=1 Tax=Oikopleura dioica TaxID=34765 RepID=A0ABN7S8G6_OIKDI|nr:Oidioi.mRNA.OKI2018_I69.XSR.g13946.t1.cds [Oikopleura dioica]